MSIQKKKRSPNYSRNKGNNYERQIVRELCQLGISAKSARSINREADANKIDIVDEKGILPPLQLKKTIQTPNYFKIRDASTADSNRFCILWAKQEAKEKNICTIGEVVLLPKDFFYELLKLYYDRESDSNLSKSGN